MSATVAGKTGETIYTSQPKSITHQVPGINPLRTKEQREAQLRQLRRPSIRLNYAYIDREVSLKNDAMSLSHYTDDIVFFYWLGD
ncbi:MAG: hypothetical protein AB7T38_09185 [Nitrospirales bacterium]